MAPRYVFKVGTSPVEVRVVGSDISGWVPTNFPALWSVELEDPDDWDEMDIGCADHGAKQAERAAAWCDSFSPGYAFLPWQVRE